MLLRLALNDGPTGRIMMSRLWIGFMYIPSKYQVRVKVIDIYTLHK